VSGGSDPAFADIEVASRRIRPYVEATPVAAAAALAGELGCGIEFKCEHLQQAGAFKSRGACNAVFALEAAVAARGVLTHSSGNHGAALARAAQLRAIPAWVVMPKGAPHVKRAAVAGYGGTVVECEPTLAAREATARELLASTGATLVHPYDDPLVIAGQGTAVLELARQIEAPQALLVPVGGGGLLSGSALAARALWPGTRVVGVEPLGADDASRSFHGGRLEPQGSPQTIADGLRGALSPRTLRLIRANVDDIVTVAEDTILAAMRMLYERLGLVVEPSGAVPFAAVLEGKVTGTRLAIVLSGGNVDRAAYPWLPPAAGPAAPLR
jgi:threonine dehydratase